MFHHFIRRDVHTSGSDGDVSVRQSPVVGIFSFGFVVGVFTHHPVVIVAAWMVTAHHLLAPCAEGHAADTHPLYLFGQGEVDIQTHTTRQTFFQHLGRNLSDDGAHRLEIGVWSVVTKREGHRGNILHAALHHDAHRAAIVGVDRRVVAVVDTAHDHVRPTRADAVEGHLHTVYGGAVAPPYLQAFLLADLFQPQRLDGREGTGIA